MVLPVKTEGRNSSFSGCYVNCVCFFFFSELRTKKAQKDFCCVLCWPCFLFGWRGLKYLNGWPSDRTLIDDNLYKR